MTVISIHTSTLVSPQDEINSFCIDIRTILRNMDKYEKFVLMEDLNVCVGCHSELWSSIRCHGMDKCNANGLLLL